MSTTKKVLIAIFSIIIIAAFAFLIIWGIINFNKVKEGMSGAGLYTKDDVDNAYKDGFNAALENKQDYENLINSYKDSLATQTDTITKLTGEREELEKSLTACQTERDSLTEQRDNLLKQIQTLEAEVEKQDGIIDDLTKQKQELIDQHQQTVNRLNAQIATLNSQIEHLNTQIQINITATNQLNGRIAELQKTVAFYEEFVGKLETDEIAVVTFEYGGTVYDIKTVNKGDKVSVDDPETSDYLIFKGWTIDGQAIDLTEYTVTKSVRIVADVTYKYVVDFTVDGKTKYTQVVEKGGYATEPEKPKKSGYTFKYWTLDGENEVHFDRTPIMANTTFIAKFVRLYTVSFQLEDGTEIVSRRIEAGTTTTPARISDNEHLVLRGWKLNGVLVDVNSCVIYEDTVFVADVTYMYTVEFIINGNQVYNKQKVEIGHNPIKPSNPTKDGYTFIGWYVGNADNIIDVSTFEVVEDVSIYSKFEKVAVYNVTFEVTTVANNRYKTDTYATTQVTEGSFAALSSTPYYTNYTFKGWSIDGTSVIDLRYYPINGDTTFKAVMQHVNAGKTYTVTYYDYSSKVATYTVTWGNYIQKPSGMLQDTVKNLAYGYHFLGWSTLPPSQQSGKNTPTVYLDGFVVTENITLYPVKYYGDNTWYV